MDWTAKVARKRDALLSRVPAQWRLPATSIPPTATTLQVIDRLSELLSDSERGITEGCPDVLMGALKQGDISARETLLAFAHRASLAMQFVCSRSKNLYPLGQGICKRPEGNGHLLRPRRIACQSCSSKLLLLELTSLMLFSGRRVFLWVHYMVCQ